MIRLLFTLTWTFLQVSANTYVAQLGEDIDMEAVLTQDLEPSEVLFIVNPQNKTSCFIDNNTVVYVKDVCQIKVEEKVVIHLKNVTEQTAGVYTWAALSSNNIVGEAFSLYILDKPTIIQNGTAVLNKPLFLHCQLNATPSLGRNKVTMRTFWTRNKKALPSNIEATDSWLKIKRYKWKNRATFVCVTMVNGVNSTQSDKLVVDAERGPTESHLIPSNSSYTKREGWSLNVSCVRDCVPKCTVKWTREGDTVSTTSMLDIGHLDRGHTGNYTCIVKNKHGEKELPVLVRVQYGPSNLKLVGPATQATLVSSPVTLSCTADCEPACEVIILSTDGGKQAIDQPLIIDSVQKNDAGTYSCSASNMLGQQNKSLELMVSYPPEVTPMSTPSKKVRSGTNVTLTCTVDSFPIPSITWGKDNTLIHGDPGRNVSKNIYTASLVVLDAQCEDAGNYSCAAVNTHGKDSTISFIDVTCPPSSPTTLSDPVYYQVLHSAKTYIHTIRGNPLPRVVNWTHSTEDGILTSVLEERDYEEDVEMYNRPIYHLKLIHMNVHYSSSGQYVVHLDNGVGTYSLRYHLVVQDRPDVPKNVTILNSTETSITLSFQKGYHGNAEQYFQADVSTYPPQNLSVTCDDAYIDGDGGTDDGEGEDIGDDDDDDIGGNRDDDVGNGDNYVGNGDDDGGNGDDDGGNGDDDGGNGDDDGGNGDDDVSSDRDDVGSDRDGEGEGGDGVGNGDDGVGDGACTADLTNLKPGTRYFIKLRAVNQIGASDYTHAVSAYTIEAAKHGWRFTKAITLLCIVFGVIVVCLLLAGLIYLLTCRPCRRRKVQLQKMRNTEGVSIEATEETQVDLWETIAEEQDPMFPAFFETGSDKRVSEYRVSRMCVESVTFTSVSPEENDDGGYVNLPFNEMTDDERHFTKHVCDGNAGFTY